MKRYKPLATELFLEDLSAVIYYIRHNKMNPLAAKRLRKDVYKAITDRALCAASFESFYGGGLELEYCRIYVGNFIIFYTLTDTEMILQRFLYGKSSYKAKLK